MELLQTPITLVILVVTVLTSIRAFSDMELKRKLLFNPYLVSNHNEWYRAFSHSLIHGDTMHLIFNMFVFFWAGASVESTFTNSEVWYGTFGGSMPFWGEMTGRLIFIGLYVGAVLFATLPAMRKHSDNPSYNSLGASGGVSAIIIAFVLINPLADLRLMFAIPMKAFVFGALFFVFESYMNKRGQTGIAHDAHLGGAIFSLIFLLVVNNGFYFHFLNLLTAYFS